MRKFTLPLVFLLAMVMIAFPAAAQGEFTLSGTLEPAAIQALTAPFSGIILSADFESGDFLPAGQTLFTLDTTKIYSPCDGIVAGLRAEELDDISDINAIYGSPMYIQPSALYTINATTSGAYDDNDNRYINIGESVYLSVSGSDRSGTGIITNVNGTGYTVEVQSGNLRLNDNCRISRDADSDVRSQRIGSGRTQRNNPVPINADGSVLRLHVLQGSEVKKGDLLMETVTGDLRDINAVSNDIMLEDDCIVQAIYAGIGDNVQQGQLLAHVYTAGSLCAEVYADEYDLPDISVGDDVAVSLDFTYGEREYNGTVDFISYTAHPEYSTPVYKITVLLGNDDIFRQGMSVTVQKGK